MSCILFPKLSFNHIYFLLFFFSYFLKQIIKKYAKSNNSDKNSKALFDMYIYIISDFFSIILFCIERKRAKTHSEKSRNSTRSQIEIEYIYNNRSRFNIRNTRLILRIFILSLSDLLAQYLPFIFSLFAPGVFPYLDYLLIFTILFIYLFCNLLLKTRFYRHHYLSFLINIISLFIFSIIHIIRNISSHQIYKILYYVFSFIMIFKTACYAFENVFGKIIIDEEFLSPVSFLLCRGISELILLLIFSIPFFFLKFNSKTLFSGFSDNLDSFISILKIILLMISNFIYNFFIWTIIDKFSPGHLTMASVLEVISYKLFGIIFESKSLPKNEYYELVIYIFLIIAACIYNEIFVIKICGLNKYTKYRFEEKALDDFYSTDMNTSMEMIPKTNTLESTENE